MTTANLVAADAADNPGGNEESEACKDIRELTQTALSQLRRGEAEGTETLRRRGDKCEGELGELPPTDGRASGGRVPTDIPPNSVARGGQPGGPASDFGYSPGKRAELAIPGHDDGRPTGEAKRTLMGNLPSFTYAGGPGPP